MQDHPKIKEIMSKTQGHARKRIVHVYELCKGKKICEGGDEIDEKLDGASGDGEAKKVMIS
jgi:DNA-directed RNA polymerase II subunit RPB1